MHRPRTGRIVCLAVALIVAVHADVSAAAEGPGDPEPQGQRAPEPPARDFLFGAPRGWLGINAGLVVPRAEGQLFTFVSDQLTVAKHDYQAPVVDLHGGLWMSPRIDLVFGGEFSESNTTSEYRAFVSDERLPISQVTTFDQVNVSAGLKIALLSRGRPLGRYAFVPRTFVPYVGGGVGAFYYKFEQNGDFVDFVTFRIFNDTFKSNGWTPSGDVFAGADVRIWRGLFLTFDARYVWAHAPLESDFVGFDGIDLSGFRLATGLNVALR